MNLKKLNTIISLLDDVVVECTYTKANRKRRHAPRMPQRFTELCVLTNAF